MTEKEREFWLRDMGYSRWKPAYYELTAKQRDWLVVSNTNPYTELGEVLEELPAERLRTLVEAYEPILNDEIIDAAANFTSRCEGVPDPLAPRAQRAAGKARARGPRSIVIQT